MKTPLQFSNHFNSNIDEEENEKLKIFIKFILDVIKTNKFKNPKEQQRSILLKRCYKYGKTGGLYNKYGKEMKDFRCIWCID